MELALLRVGSVGPRWGLWLALTGCLMTTVLGGALLRAGHGTPRER
jgi:hypothetical protein